MRLGAILGIPVGVLSGIYISEYSKSIISMIVKFTTDVLSGVPSIVIGIFAYGVIVIPMQRFSALAGGFALGILMIPTITKITEEMLRLVPQSLSEASLALGVSRWKTTLRIVLKSASSGIITGILLAIARAAGETAPLFSLLLEIHSGRRTLTNRLQRCHYKYLHMQFRLMKTGTDRRGLERLF